MEGYRPLPRLRFSVALFQGILLNRNGGPGERGLITAQPAAPASFGGYDALFEQRSNGCFEIPPVPQYLLSITQVISLKDRTAVLELLPQPDERIWAELPSATRFLQGRRVMHQVHPGIGAFDKDVVAAGAAAEFAFTMYQHTAFQGCQRPLVQDDKLQALVG